MPIMSPLSEEARKVTGEALQSAVADLVDLSLVAKQAHWNLIGPRFRSIHLQLDEIYDVARRYTDTVAERATAIGVSPDGCADTVARESRVPAITKGWAKEDDVIDYFVSALAAVVAAMRERIDATERADAVSQDLFIAATAELEKEYWMVQATQQT
ncbi:DNA starvation/stationary phase protection protein [Pseudonocardia sp. RS11V-5]|uniref:Dps family protein n=1 Tax=Pseudonocardia terrae TaxID=2905831 RepID=UPI001E591187|nr:DNA starvation/stationary phase protection protein [Pseudonocardia terrae]MCE3556516.1 DNA starvation/stationary phase protection protein [Pseudonocardia terrae]